MNIFHLIGMPYRLGAIPERHKAVDCLSLCRTVLDSYGIKSPEPERDWYRRLKREDYSIFKEQLELWGNKIDSSRIEKGAVALFSPPDSNVCCLAVYWENGWLTCSKGLAVKWNPLGVFTNVEYYYPMKKNCVNLPG